MPSVLVLAPVRNEVQPRGWKIRAPAHFCVIVQGTLACVCKETLRRARTPGPSINTLMVSHRTELKLPRTMTSQRIPQGRNCLREYL